MQKKILAWFCAVALLAWVMPLGAFIDKDVQQQTCGGKRAFHMCEMKSVGVDSGTPVLQPSNETIQSAKTINDFSTALQGGASVDQEVRELNLLLRPHASIFTPKPGRRLISFCPQPAAPVPKPYLYFLLRHNH